MNKFPRALLALLIAYLILGTLYSTTTPLFEAPDEQWHFAFVQHLAQGRGLPIQSLPLDHLARQEGSQPPLYYLLAAALTVWIDTTDYPGLVWENPHYGYDVPGIVNDNKNLFIHTAQESFPYHNTSLAIHLARWLSLALGALAVFFTYQIALLISPLSLWERGLGGEGLAAALVAFTPQFLFISSAVSNDSTIVAACSLALWLLVRSLQRSPTTRDAIFIGAACGLCALAKVSGIAMLPLAILLVAYASRSNLRALVSNLSALVLTFLVLSGWWYARNLVLYGELTGTTRMLDIFGARSISLSFDVWRAQLNEVYETFWLGFGWGNIRAMNWVYGLFGVLTLGGLFGLANLIVRSVAGEFQRRTNWSEALKSAPYIVLAAWIAVILIALFNWMTLTQAPHGRLLFPALPALAVLIVYGWTQFVSRFPRLFTFLWTTGLFLLASGALFQVLMPAYAFPRRLTEKDLSAILQPVNISYDDKIMLLGSQVSPHPVDPKHALQLDLYWRVLAPMERDYSLNLAALDQTYRVIGSRNSYHGHGMLPTRLMQAGETFHDTYWLPIQVNSSGTTRGFIQVTVYVRETQNQLTAFDPSRNEITPIISRFEITP